MKVEELKQGMILQPLPLLWTNKRMVFHLQFKTDEEGNSYWNVSCGARKHRPPGHDIAVYIGYERAGFFMNGVRKHHLLLVDGNVARMDGYEFRYIEPAS